MKYIFLKRTKETEPSDKQLAKFLLSLSFFFHWTEWDTSEHAKTFPQEGNGNKDTITHIIWHQSVVLSRSEDKGKTVWIFKWHERIRHLEKNSNLLAWCADVLHKTLVISRHCFLADVKQICQNEKPHFRGERRNHCFFLITCAKFSREARQLPQQGQCLLTK